MKNGNNLTKAGSELVFADEDSVGFNWSNSFGNFSGTSGIAVRPVENSKFH